MTDIMKFIKEERRKQGISQSELANAIMMNPGSIYFWENYKFVPKFEAVENMLDVLGYELVINKKESWEWCRDCKEYDKENHCCHRWSKQIRKTIEELKENYKGADDESLV